MNRYVKKPIAIEAVKWKGFNNDEIKDFAGDSVKIEVIREGDADNGIPPSVDCSIETLEGVMKAKKNGRRWEDGGCSEGWEPARFLGFSDMI